MSKFELWVDGGGGVKGIDAYFSYMAIYKGQVIKKVKMDRWLVKNLTPNLIPTGCVLTDKKGLATNNIAEYCALYFGLAKIKEVYDAPAVKVFQDSELVVSQVFGNPKTGKLYAVNKDWLLGWRDAIWSILWGQVEMQWVSGNKMKQVIGH